MAAADTLRLLSQHALLDRAERTTRAGLAARAEEYDKSGQHGKSIHREWGKGGAESGQMKAVDRCPAGISPARGVRPIVSQASTAGRRPPHPALRQAQGHPLPPGERVRREARSRWERGWDTEQIELHLSRQGGRVNVSVVIHPEHAVSHFCNEKGEGVKNHHSAYIQYVCQCFCAIQKGKKKSGQELHAGSGRQGDPHHCSSVRQ